MSLLLPADGPPRCLRAIFYCRGLTLDSYDADEQKRINQARPWRKDPHHFKKVRISATALIKMVRWVVDSERMRARQPRTAVTGPTY